ncbi:zinc finger protein AEBP2-like [Dysidea avara]|uniref:zinc finger protein AEBP2-like n=1 Tax=Dysidea avara TaxID=196820 RepID=UPI00332AEA66
MPPKLAPKLKQSPKKTSDDDFDRCRWRSCGCVGFSSFEELAEHVNMEHVGPMLSQEVVYCLWEDCRMYNRPCYSRDWLQRHVRVHTREKPHKCIINGCLSSFFTTEALSKHVETHFKTKKGPSLHHTTNSKKLKLSCESKRPKIKPKIAAAATAIDPLTSLLFANEGTFFSVDDDDFGLDSLTIFKSASAHLSSNDCYYGRRGSSCNHITLHATIQGRRLCKGQSQVLVRWKPPLIDEAWLPVSDIPPYTTVSISQLSYQQQCRLASCLVMSHDNRKRKSMRPHKLTDHQ